jgi:tetratricopeptide (TPR) repeat protein
LGKPEEAVALLQKAAAEAPNDWAIWTNLGNALDEAKELDQAISAFQKAASLNPQAAIAHLNLGKALESAGRYQESCKAFERSAQLDSVDGLAEFEHGKLRLKLGEAQAALTLLSSAARVRRNDAEVYVLIGLSLILLDDFPKAEQSFRMALHVNPTSVRAYFNLAVILERANRLPEVEDLYARAIDNGVDPDQLTYVKAMILRREGKLAEALECAKASEKSALDPGWRTNFIGEVADKLGETDTAFAAYSEMNAISAGNPIAARFGRGDYRRRVAEMERGLTPSWYRSWRPIELEKKQPDPAFLVGFFRSGTTLLDTILMSHPDTHVIEEEPLLAAVEQLLGSRMMVGSIGSAQANKLRDHYFAAPRQPIPSDKLVIDKNPIAILRSPMIARFFPDAKIIFTLRHPCDVVLSCFMQNFQVTELMASFLDLENGARMYAQAMSFWKKSREIFPLNVHEVRYEDMVEDLEAELRPLLEFLGLPWDDKILDHQTTAKNRGYIRTPSYAQVTEKIYSRASGRWTRYRKQMEPVLPILEPWVKEFGYSLD